MADLKTTIAQTENLKNKVKLAKDRINQVVVRGGGITSKSLSEIPDNINKMLGQYNKIAVINFPTPVPIEDGKVQLNLSFIPKQLILHVEAFGFSSVTKYLNPIIPEPLTNLKKIKLFWDSNCTYYADVTKMTSEELTWKKYDSAGTYKKGRIKQIIAIG